MGKKNRKKKDNVALPKATPTPQMAVATSFALRDWQALVIVLLMAVASYIFSFYYTSFYQGEEGAQYMNALGFWHNPSTILGNWPKTGWKLIYAPIVLFGKQGVLVANCLFSAFTAFFTYKIAAKLMQQRSVLPLLLLFTQSLWFLLSFKFYSETLTAFLLSISLYFYYCNRYLLFAIFASYVLLLRQEFIFIFPWFAIILLKKKKWIPVLALGIFPLLYNCWGWYITGDYLYSIHESQRTAALYKSSYPRQGFDHYFIMSGTIFNYVVLTLVVTYLAQIILRLVKKPDWPLLIPALGYFLVHCLFNLKAMELLTSTGGNLRYLLAISPLMAVLATRAVDNMRGITHKYRLLIFLIPLFITVTVAMTFPHNWVIMDKDSGERNLIPLIFCSGTILLLLVVSRYRSLVLSIGVLSVISLLVSVRPKKLCCDENFEQQKIADYIKSAGLDKKPLYQSLALFNFFYGKNPWDFPAGNFGINGDSSLQKAPKGAIIIWDSHYATKYGKVEINYFQKNIRFYRVLREFRSDDQAFGAIVFEKIQ